MPTSYKPSSEIWASYNGFKLNLNGAEEWIGSKEKSKLPILYSINKVKGITVLKWEDGTITKVQKTENDEFNPRLAFLTAFFQHYSGLSKNKANKFLANLQIEKPKENKKKPKHMKEETNGEEN